MTARRVLLSSGAAAAFCAWCGWVSGFHRSTAAAVVTWVVSLGVVVLADVMLWRGSLGRHPGWRVARKGRPWPRPGRGGVRRALVGVSHWVVLFLVVVVWEVLGIDTGPHEAHLTISALAQAFRPVNAVLLAAWMLTGVGYGWARARRPAPGRERARSVPKVGRPGSGAAGVLGHGGPLWPALLLPSNRAVGVAFWVALIVVGVLVDVAARRSDGRLATAEELVRFVSTGRVVNLLLVVAWAFAGYHLFAR